MSVCIPLPILCIIHYDDDDDEDGDGDGDIDDDFRVNGYVRRLGGAYGEKISRSCQATVACALVTQKLQRPCRVILPLATHYKSTGKRFPCSTDYEVRYFGQRC